MVNIASPVEHHFLDARLFGQGRKSGADPFRSGDISTIPFFRFSLDPFS